MIMGCPNPTNPPTNPNDHRKEHAFEPSNIPSPLREIFKGCKLSISVFKQNGEEDKMPTAILTSIFQCRCYLILIRYLHPWRSHTRCKQFSLSVLQREGTCHSQPAELQRDSSDRINNHYTQCVKVRTRQLIQIGGNYLLISEMRE